MNNTCTSLFYKAFLSKAADHFMYFYSFIYLIYLFNFVKAFLQIYVGILYIQPLAAKNTCSLVCSMHSINFSSSIFETRASLKNHCQYSTRTTQFALIRIVKIINLISISQFGLFAKVKKIVGRQFSPQEHF